MMLDIAMRAPVNAGLQLKVPWGRQYQIPRRVRGTNDFRTLHQPMPYHFHPLRVRGQPAWMIPSLSEESKAYVFHNMVRPRFLAAARNDSEKRLRMT